MESFHQERWKMSDPSPDLDLLGDAGKFKEFLITIDGMESLEKIILVETLEKQLTSSSWVSNEIFKPGVRNLYLQEKLGATGMYNKMILFLGDQYYHFKFFFQNKMSKGDIPAVLDLLQQGVNSPRFRFRLEAIECLIELRECLCLPTIINLLNGFDKKPAEAIPILEILKQNLDFLAGCMDREEKYRELFSILRLRMLELDSMNNTRPA